MPEIKQNAEPLMPGGTYLVSIRTEDKGKVAQFMLTLRAAVIQGKQTWTFHAPGNENATVISIRDV